MKHDQAQTQPQVLQFQANLLTSNPKITVGHIAKFKFTEPAIKSIYILHR